MSVGRLRPSVSLRETQWFPAIIYVVVALALCGSFGSLRFGATILCILLFFICVVSCRKRLHPWIALTAGSLAVAALCSPIDVYGPLHGPIQGPPHVRIVRLAMGKPRLAALAASRRGEVVLGGCLVSGKEPKYVLIW